MTHRLPVLTLLPVLGFALIGPAFTSHQHSRISASFLCEEPKSVAVGGHTIGPTPEVCVPFIQWPPASAAR